jgi:beta-glucosidase/6-phospho-beta-glucosidase/beta-galactosidase
LLAEQPLFQSFFLGGFECSTHRLRNGKRLDLIASTKHDVFVREDYARLQRLGITTVREGTRWHLIERSPGVYDFSSILPMLRAARDMGMQVIWDLCHYGYPDDLDIFSPEFLRRFGKYVTAFTRLVQDETGDVPFYCPVNEISFFSWAGGDGGHLNPYAFGRGFELKQQLVRAAIEAIEAIWSVEPRARIIHTDPVIHIIPDPKRPHERAEAEGYRMAQYQSWDMLSGRLYPELGGAEHYLDIIGANFYPNNEWVYNGPMIKRYQPEYKPFRRILFEVYERYGRPMFISETSTENKYRAAWFRYVCREVRAAIEDGIPLHGICWYPILNHPGWVDDRHCENGFWDYCNEQGERVLYVPLAMELSRQQRALARLVYS